MSHLLHFGQTTDGGASSDMMSPPECGTQFITKKICLYKKRG